jgi:AcrR family transcriptional regulator
MGGPHGSVENTQNPDPQQGPSHDTSGSGRDHPRQTRTQQGPQPQAILKAAQKGLHRDRIRRGHRARHHPRTDLAAGTFYNYFPDKQSVFLELLNEKLRILNDEVRAARRSATDAESFFRNSYRALFTFMARDRDAFELLRRNAGTVRSLIDDSIYDVNIQQSVQDIRSAIEKGILPAGGRGVSRQRHGRHQLRTGRAHGRARTARRRGRRQFASALVTGGIARLGKPRRTEGPRSEARDQPLEKFRKLTPSSETYECRPGRKKLTPR